MFSAHTERLRAEVEGLLKVLFKHEQIRSLVWPVPPSSGETPGWLESIKQSAPDVVIWKVYDHSAAYTRLYALFERFIFDVIEEWLVMLPSLYKNYTDLPESVQTAHRFGIGQILSKLGGDQYQHLSEEAILQGISNGVVAKTDYTCLPDAFYTDGNNLWPGVLASLLKKVGIDGAWGWISRHRSVKAFLRDFRGDSSTPESELKSIVHYRNLAAHGDISEVVSVEDFGKVAKFVIAIAESVAELVMSKVIERRLATGYLENLGSVIHSFSGNIAGVTASGAKIGINDTIVVYRDNACYFSVVKRIEVEHVSHDSLTPRPGQAIALELSNLAKVDAKLFRMLTVPDASFIPVPIIPVTTLGT
jgi:MAE_28990/MAE_18760-like HEPN